MPPKRTRGRKPPKIKLATLHLVGEGAEDKAFLQHLKNLYDGRATSQKVSIDAGDGGSPGNVISTVAGRCRGIDYDAIILLLDSDIEIERKDRERARRSNIQIVQSAPTCLEGMLLEALGHEAPRTNQECKSTLHRQLNGRATDPDSYSDLFTVELLDNTGVPQLALLRDAIKNEQR